MKKLLFLFFVVLISGCATMSSTQLENVLKTSEKLDNIEKDIKFQNDALMQYISTMHLTWQRVDGISQAYKVSYVQVTDPKEYEKIVEKAKADAMKKAEKSDEPAEVK